MPVSAVRDSRLAFAIIKAHYAVKRRNKDSRTLVLMLAPRVSKRRWLAGGGAVNQENRSGLDIPIEGNGRQPGQGANTVDGCSRACFGAQPVHEAYWKRPRFQRLSQVSVEMRGSTSMVRDRTLVRHLLHDACFSWELHNIAARSGPAPFDGVYAQVTWSPVRNVRVLSGT